jgi:hypothetical protein
MRARPIFAIVVLLAAAVVGAAPATAASGRGAHVLAQQTSGNEEQAQGQESSNKSGQGQGSAGAESGAAGSTEGGSSTQSDVPWTFQMARLSIVLLVLLLGAIGLFYYRLVIKRQRGEV